MLDLLLMVYPLNECDGLCFIILEQWKLHTVFGFLSILERGSTRCACSLTSLLSFS